MFAQEQLLENMDIFIINILGYNHRGFLILDFFFCSSVVWKKAFSKCKPIVSQLLWGFKTKRFKWRTACTFKNTALATLNVNNDITSVLSFQQISSNLLLTLYGYVMLKGLKVYIYFFFKFSLMSVGYGLLVALSANMSCLP